MSRKCLSPFSLRQWSKNIFVYFLSALPEKRKRIFNCNRARSLSPIAESRIIYSSCVRTFFPSYISCSFLLLLSFSLSLVDHSIRLLATTRECFRIWNSWQFENEKFMFEHFTKSLKAKRQSEMNSHFWNFIRNKTNKQKNAMKMRRVCATSVDRVVCHIVDNNACMCVLGRLSPRNAKTHRSESDFLIRKQKTRGQNKQANDFWLSGGVTFFYCRI